MTGDNTGKQCCKICESTSKIGAWNNFLLCRNCREGFKRACLKNLHACVVKKGSCKLQSFTKKCFFCRLQHGIKIGLPRWVSPIDKKPPETETGCTKRQNSSPEPVACNKRRKVSASGKTPKQVNSSSQELSEHQMAVERNVSTEAIASSSGENLVNLKTTCKQTKQTQTEIQLDKLVLELMGLLKKHKYKGESALQPSFVDEASTSGNAGSVFRQPSSPSKSFLSNLHNQHRKLRSRSRREVAVRDLSSSPVAYGNYQQDETLTDDDICLSSTSCSTTGSLYQEVLKSELKVEDSCLEDASLPTNSDYDLVPCATSTVHSIAPIGCKPRRFKVVATRLQTENISDWKREKRGTKDASETVESYEVESPPCADNLSLVSVASGNLDKINSEDSMKTGVTSDSVLSKETQENPKSFQGESAKQVLNEKLTSPVRNSKVKQHKKQSSDTKTTKQITCADSDSKVKQMKKKKIHNRTESDDSLASKEEKLSMGYSHAIMVSSAAGHRYPAEQPKEKKPENNMEKIVNGPLRGGSKERKKTTPSKERKKENNEKRHVRDYVRRYSREEKDKSSEDEPVKVSDHEKESLPSPKLVEYIERKVINSDKREKEKELASRKKKSWSQKPGTIQGIRSRSSSHEGYQAVEETEMNDKQDSQAEKCESSVKRDDKTPEPEKKRQQSRKTSKSEGSGNSGIQTCLKRDTEIKEKSFVASKDKTVMESNTRPQVQKTKHQKEIQQVTEKERKKKVSKSKDKGRNESSDKLTRKESGDGLRELERTPEIKNKDQEVSRIDQSGKKNAEKKDYKEAVASPIHEGGKDSTTKVHGSTVEQTYAMSSLVNDTTQQHTSHLESQKVVHVEYDINKKSALSASNKCQLEAQDISSPKEIGVIANKRQLIADMNNKHSDHHEKAVSGVKLPAADYSMQTDERLRMETTSVKDVLGKRKESTKGDKCFLGQVHPTNMTVKHMVTPTTAIPETMSAESIPSVMGSVNYEKSKETAQTQIKNPASSGPRVCLTNWTGLRSSTASNQIQSKNTLAKSRPDEEHFPPQTNNCRAEAEGDVDDDDTLSIAIDSEQYFEELEEPPFRRPLPTAKFAECLLSPKYLLPQAQPEEMLPRSSSPKYSPQQNSTENFSCPLKSPPESAQNATFLANVRPSTKVIFPPKSKVMENLAEEDQSIMEEDGSCYKVDNQYPSHDFMSFLSEAPHNHLNNNPNIDERMLDFESTVGDEDQRELETLYQEVTKDNMPQEEDSHSQSSKSSSNSNIIHIAELIQQDHWNNLVSLLLNTGSHRLLDTFQHIFHFISLPLSEVVPKFRNFVDACKHLGKNHDVQVYMGRLGASLIHKCAVDKLWASVFGIINTMKGQEMEPIKYPPVPAVEYSSGCLAIECIEAYVQMKDLNMAVSSFQEYMCMPPDILNMKDTDYKRLESVVYDFLLCISDRQNIKGLTQLVGRIFQVLLEKPQLAAHKFFEDFLKYCIQNNKTEMCIVLLDMATTPELDLPRNLQRPLVVQLFTGGEKNRAKQQFEAAQNSGIYFQVEGITTDNVICPIGLDYVYEEILLAVEDILQKIADIVLSSGQEESMPRLTFKMKKSNSPEDDAERTDVNFKSILRSLQPPIEAMKDDCEMLVKRSTLQHHINKLCEELKKKGRHFSPAQFQLKPQQCSPSKLQGQGLHSKVSENSMYHPMSVQQRIQSPSQRSPVLTIRAGGMFAQQQVNVSQMKHSPVRSPGLIGTGPASIPQHQALVLHQSRGEGSELLTIAPGSTASQLMSKGHSPEQQGIGRMHLPLQQQRRMSPVEGEVMLPARHLLQQHQMGLALPTGSMHSIPHQQRVRHDGVLQRNVPFNNNVPAPNMVDNTFHTPIRHQEHGYNTFLEPMAPPVTDSIFKMPEPPRSYHQPQSVHNRLGGSSHPTPIGRGFFNRRGSHWNRGNSSRQNGGQWHGHPMSHLPRGRGRGFRGDFHPMGSAPRQPPRQDLSINQVKMEHADMKRKPITYP